MWAAVLVSFLTPAITSLLWRPSWFESRRLLAAAEAGIERIRTELNLDLVITPPPSPSGSSPVVTASAPVMERPASAVAVEKTIAREEPRNRNVARDRRPKYPESRLTPEGKRAVPDSKVNETRSRPAMNASVVEAASTKPRVANVPGLVAVDERPPSTPDAAAQPKPNTPARGANRPAGGDSARKATERSSGGGRAASSPAAAPSPNRSRHGRESSAGGRRKRSTCAIPSRIFHRSR